MHRLLLIAAYLICTGLPDARGQLLATDDFENYSGDPRSSDGGSGDWGGRWTTNSEFAGGTYLNTSSFVSGVKSIGLFGLGSETGTSIRREFPPSTNLLTISFSMRANFNANSVNAPTRRMAFTIRAGNGSSHFDDQRLSFFFAAGNNNFQWYDGTNRESSAILFSNGAVYDVRAVVDPSVRTYSFTASNRATGASLVYNGNWTEGRNLEPLNSVAFIMRAPNITGQDAFLDNVSISAPDFRAPGPSIREGDWWRYYKGTSTPPVQGTNQWFHPSFDDKSWSPPSPSGFGYGDCDDHTELTDMQNGYLNIFTRKPFVVGNPASISELSLGVDYDDGAIVFLNGTEVARLNLPAGAFSRTNQALSAREASRGEKGSNPNPKSYIAVDPALLTAGTNVIAVSGHNVSTNSSDFTLIVEVYTNAALVRGPFIQMPDTGHTAAIAWNTAAEVDSVVDYGTDLTYNLGTISNGTPKRGHVIHLSELAPGTSYFYRVRGQGEILSEGNSFRTRPSADQPFRFVVIGDHGQGTDGMYSIADRINERTDFDALFTVGDNIYGAACNSDGAPGWYDPYWFKLYEPTMRRVATLAAVGNHDWDTAQAQFFVDYFHMPTNGPAGQLEKNYSFEFGNMHVAVIDTEPYEDNTTASINEINAWLNADLSSATQLWRVVILHRPPYTSTGAHNDNARVKQHIVPILKTNGVHLVLQGHNHFYERINPIDGITYLTTGSAGAALYAEQARKDYSARFYNERHSYTMIDVVGGRMNIQQINDLGTVIDTHSIEITHPFSIDGLLDDPAWGRATNGLILHAAIRKNFLYLATQDAGEGNDHFIYLADTMGIPRAANWSKTGTIPAWSAFLADENDGAFNGWFNAAGGMMTDFNAYKSMTSGTNNNAPQANGVLEGTIDLAARFGSLPATLYLAAAPYATADAGALASAAQVPTGNGDGNIDFNEFLTVNTRDLALDLPTANAGVALTNEAGMWIPLNGSGGSPAGFPLHYFWLQSTTADILITNADQAVAAFVTVSNVVAATQIDFTLRTQDGRFFSDPSVVSMVIVPAIDSDQDGLSDQEESTGSDNLLTIAAPSAITSPTNRDTDGDGMSDGDEALAGTSPTNSASVFKAMEASVASGSTIDITWPVIPGRTYTFERNPSLSETGWMWIQTLSATSSTMRTTDSNDVGHLMRVYRLGAKY